MMECPLALCTHDDEEKHESTSPKHSFICFHTSPSVLPESRSEACGTRVPGSLPVVCVLPRRPAPQWTVQGGVTPSSARPAAPRGGALQQPANFNWKRWEFQTVLSQLSSSSFGNRLIPIMPRFWPSSMCSCKATCAASAMTGLVRHGRKIRGSRLVTMSRSERDKWCPWMGWWSRQCGNERSKLQTFKRSSAGLGSKSRNLQFCSNFIALKLFFFDTETGKEMSECWRVQGWKHPIASWLGWSPEASPEALKEVRRPSWAHWKIHQRSQLPGVHRWSTKWRSWTLRTQGEQ